MTRTCFFRGVLIGVLLCCPGLADGAVSFREQIAPILVKRCLGCHNNRKSEGRFALHTFEMLLKAGDSGDPPIVPGAPDESYLYGKLIDEDDELRMPLEDDSLSAKQVELVREWIRQGARFDGADRSQQLVNLLPSRVHPAPPARYRTTVPVFANTTGRPYPRDAEQARRSPSGVTGATGVATSTKLVHQAWS